MQGKYNDVMSSIFFCLFAIFMLIASNWIQPTTSDILGSRFFPRMVAILIAGLSLFQLTCAYLAIKKSKNAEIEQQQSERKQKNKINIPLLLTVVTLFGYYILISVLGFVLTSIIYLLCQSAILMSKEDLSNKKKVSIVTIVSIIVPIFLDTIFWRVFSIALPSGVLF